MKSKNEKHFSRKLNIQVCELLKRLTEATIERCFEKKVFLKKVIFSKVDSLRAYSWQLYQQINSFTSIFQRFYLDFKNAVLSPNHATLCIDSSPPFPHPPPP